MGGGAPILKPASTSRHEGLWPRAPTFLLANGHEQVRSIVAELAGDREAARRVELVLPETGSAPARLAGVAERRAAAPLADA